MSRSLILDPRAERAANAPLEIHTEVGRGPGVYATGHRYPDPEQIIREAQGREGQRRGGPPIYANRDIPLELYILGRREGYPADLTNGILNPSAEIDAAGYGANFCAVARTTAQQYVGEAAFELTSNGAGSVGIFSLFANGAVAAPGEQWTFTFAVLATVARTARADIRWFNAAGADLPNEVGIATASRVGEWVLVTVTGIAPANTARVGGFARASDAAIPNGEKHYVDRMILRNTTGIANPGVLDYFDGDAPGSSWTGVPHASTSTQPGDADVHFEAIAADLEAKLSKLRDEGGTYSRPFRAGRVVFDVEGISAGGDGDYNGRRWIQRGGKAAATLDCLPFARGDLITKAARPQNTDPVQIYTEADIPGAVRALAEIEVTDNQAVDRRSFVGAVEDNRDYDITAATAALYYQAEALTPLGAGVTAGATGAAGGSVVRAQLNPQWAACLSTKVAASGLHLTHVGLFRVFARIKATGTGTIQARLEHAQGDLNRRRQNLIKGLTPGAYYLVDLGLVRVEPTKAGTQRWEGRILAKSTVTGDSIDIDDVRIMPAGRAYVEVRRPVTLPTPASYSQRDGFPSSSGSLGGMALETGGIWVTTGDGDDFQHATGKVIRAGFGDSGAPLYGFTGRLAIAPAVLTTLAVRIDFTIAQLLNNAVMALAGRYTDANNYVLAWLRTQQSGYTSGLNITGIKSGPTQFLQAGFPVVPLVGQPNRLELLIENTGLLAVWFNGQLLGVRWAADLATGGALASGKVGFFDENGGATAAQREYMNFASWVPTLDAAIYASRKLRWSHNAMQREDAAGGGLWSDLPYEGDPLYVPPTTREKRLVRVALMPSRGDLDQIPDGTATAGSGESDDFTSQLSLIPRFVTVRK